MDHSTLNPHPCPADLDRTADHLQCGVNLVDAVHTAMTESHDDPSSYTDALLGSILYLEQVAKELRAIIYQKVEDMDALYNSHN